MPTAPDPIASTVDAPRALARAYAACALSIGTSLAFFVTGVAPLPVLFYFPLSRRFSFYPGQGELSMDFYGRALLALLFGTALSLIVYLLATPTDVQRPTSDRTDRADGSSSRIWLLAAYTATAALLAAGLFAYQLSARIPTPEPLPISLLRTTQTLAAVVRI